MKKLTAGIFATLLAVVATEGAYAAITSKAYVDEQDEQRVAIQQGTDNGILTTSATGAVQVSTSITQDRVDGLSAALAEKQNADTAVEVSQAGTAVGSATQPVYINAQGVATTTDALGGLAWKSTVTSADITDATITEADLNTTINDSLDKADSALQAVPVATTEALGGVKSGNDIEVSGEGVVTVSHATTADSATKATQDGAGNIITDTYETKANVATLEGKVTQNTQNIATINSELDTMATSETIGDLSTLTTTEKNNLVGAINELDSTKQEKLTGTVGSASQPVYLNNGTITAGDQLGALATQDKVTDSVIDDGAISQSKINGLVADLAEKITKPGDGETSETGTYVLTYSSTDGFKWETIER